MRLYIALIVVWLGALSTAGIAGPANTEHASSHGAPGPAQHHQTANHDRGPAPADRAKWTMGAQCQNKVDGVVRVGEGDQCAQKPDKHSRWH